MGLIALASLALWALNHYGALRAVEQALVRSDPSHERIMPA